MDKEVQENSVTAVVGASKDGERVSNWHKQVPNEQKVFRNNLLGIISNVENSSECNVNEILREELKNDVIREKIICQLLRKDFPIYDKNAHGKTLLQAAFKEGCYDALRSALDNLTGNFNPANKDDVSHFHIACVTNHYLAAENYLKCGLDPNSPLSLDYAEYSGLNPVEFAIQKNYSELFVTLLKYNGDLSRKNAKGLTPLHMIYYSSFRNNGKSWIKQAFKYGNDKKFINSKDGCGVQHFHLSCMLAESDFVQAFINNGANVNDPVSLTCPLNPGFTPLHFATINGCEKVIELLLKSGADPNKLDKEGKTPLHLVAEIFFGDNYISITPVLPDIVRIMLKYKANPFITDMNRATPLHVSFYKAKTRPQDILQILMNELENEWGSINYTDDHGLSLFHIACDRNDSGAVLNFLNSGVNVNSRVSSGMYGGYTALHFAVQFNCDDEMKQKTLQVLLERGAKVNEKEDEFGYTPLGLICEQLYQGKCLDIERWIPMLLKYKASPVIADKKGCTPLHKYFHRADELSFYIFDALVSEVQWGSDNCTDDQGLSFFHIACTIGDVIQVTKFLISGVNVNSRVSSGKYAGFTALHFAVMHNQKEVVEILLKRNANVNERARGKSAVTPLHLACEFNCKKFNQEYKCCSNQKDIIKLLLLQGAEVNAKDSNGLTPLLLACMIDNCQQRDWRCMSSEYNTRNNLHYYISVRLQEVITLLIANKADIHARTKNQRTALHIISRCRILKNSETLVKLLLTSGIEVNAVDDLGLTPLHISLMWVNNNLLKSLLNHNANPNVVSNNSRTPLVIAADHIIGRRDDAEDIEERRDAFFILVENGSDVNVRCTRGGDVLLHAAIRACNNFLIDNLLKYGADINMEDSHGNCAVSHLLERPPDRKLWVALRIIFFHMKWLEALKLPINPKVQNCYDQLYSRYEKDLQESGEYVSPNESYIQCRTELDMLKNVKIDSYTSLYDILLKDPHELIKHVENINLVETATNDNTYKKFPLYGYLLKRQIKRGLKRREVSQSADTALRHVLNINLPDLCCDFVLKYLTNEEVANLVKAAPIKRNLIRKSCDNSSQNETVSKLRKTETA